MNQIQEIFGKKVVQGKIFYYVKLKGRPESENCWVVAENIENLNEVLEKFEGRGEDGAVKVRKGSFSNGDEVKRVVQIVWNEERNESMGEVEWRNAGLYNGLYPVKQLHEACPREMCEVYYSLLKFTYTP